MYRKNITRTIQTTEIKGFVVEVVEGNPVTNEVSLLVVGNPSVNESVKLLRKEYGENAVVSTCVTTAKTYSVPVKDFIELATVSNENATVEEVQYEEAN